MPTFIHTADGAKSTFNCPSSSTNKVARVNGVPVPISLSDLSTVTLFTAPDSGATVEVFAEPFNGADPLTSPFTLDSAHVPVITPVVRYYGAGSELLSYTVDAMAKTMDIFPASAKTEY